MHLLLVDDVYSNLDALEAAILSYLGKDFVFTKSYSGHDALSKIEARKFDLVITDLLMPFGDGYFLVEEIRKNHITVPIIVWTGIDDIDYKTLQGFSVDSIVPRREPIDKLMERIDLISKNKTAPHQ